MSDCIESGHLDVNEECVKCGSYEEDRFIYGLLAGIVLASFFWVIILVLIMA